MTSQGQEQLMTGDETTPTTVESTWKVDDDGAVWMPDDIVESDAYDNTMEAYPIIGVRLRLGTARMMVSAVEARRMAAVLIESAERVERGEGWARLDGRGL